MSEAYVAWNVTKDIGLGYTWTVHAGLQSKTEWTGWALTRSAATRQAKRAAARARRAFGESAEWHSL